MQTSRALTPFPDAWLPPGATVTTGNNADVYLDSNGDDRADSTTTSDLQNGRPTSASQTFDFSFGDGLTGQDPRQSKAAAATNLFYFLNTAHDYYYSLGFTEAAGAYQTDKFGRGGTGHDAVLGEAQFGGFTNNAAFAPTPVGVAPRIRLGLFTRSTAALTDDLDSDYDGETVIHEYGHVRTGLSVSVQVRTNCGQASEISSLAASVASQTATPEFLNWAHSPDNQNPVCARNSAQRARQCCWAGFRATRNLQPER
jgi:hypothetical protein